jgi:hypothetical protein
MSAQWKDSAIKWSAEAHGFQLDIYDRDQDGDFWWRVIDPTDTEPLAMNGVHSGEAKTREGAKKIAEAYALAASVRRDVREEESRDAPKPGPDPKKIDELTRL